MCSPVLVFKTGSAGNICIQIIQHMLCTYKIDAQICQTDVYISSIQKYEHISLVLLLTGSVFLDFLMPMTYSYLLRLKSFPVQITVLKSFLEACMRMYCNSVFPVACFIVLKCQPACLCGCRMYLGLQEENHRHAFAPE